MRINRTKCAILSLLALLASSAVMSSEKLAPKVSEGILAPHKSNRIIIKRNRFRHASISPDSILRKLRVIARFKSLGDYEVVELPTGISVKDGMKRLAKDPTIEMMAPDYFLYATELPNDPEFSKQWALNNMGQTEGLTDADLNAPEGWITTKGNKETVIGIIDTGVNYKHQDLAGNMWVNPGEIPGNGIDDDGNGYIDDIHGINAITGTGDPMDDNGHGSHVAGIIGAVGNNGLGISGVMQSASIIGCKFLDARGSGSSTAALKCLDYFANLATREKNKVVIVATNNSWAGGGYSAILEAAIKKHMDAGILFMAAASNDGLNNDLVETYPTNYVVSNIVSVAAIDHKNQLAKFSNYGLFSVDVSAPGVDIYSTLLGEDGYKSLSGTSMATPNVTGLAGLIRAAHPSLTWKETKNLIISSGAPSAILAASTISGRSVRAADIQGIGALSCEGQKVQKRLSPRKNFIALPLGSEVPILLMNIECAMPLTTPVALLNHQPVEVNDDGLDGDQVAQDGLFSGRVKPTNVGTLEMSFFDNDTVQVNIFDSKLWRSYRVSDDRTYKYRDIVGTSIPVGDDSIHQVPSPFPLKFGSNQGGFSAINVSSNGVLSVTDDVALGWDNKMLPFNGASSLIAPYWDDLTPAGNSEASVRYAVLGSAPRREFVIEWHKMHQYNVANDDLTFQVVFFEDSTNILFNYRDVDLGDNPFGNGGSATVGVQIAKNKAVMVAHDRKVLKSNSAILFVENSAPVANAGTSQTVLRGEAIKLNAAMSFDPDGDQLSYKWRILGDTQMTFTEQTTPTLDVPTTTLDGEYVFELTVTDQSGDSDTDTVAVSVIDTGDSDGSPGVTPPDEADLLPAPIMVSPLDHEHLSGDLNFEFTSLQSRGSHALTYDLEVHRIRDFTSLVIAYTAIAESPSGITSIRLDRKLDAGAYEWRLRTKAGAAYSSWVRAQFTIDEDYSTPLPPEPFVSEAANLGRFTVKNSTSSAAGPLSYSFYISESPNFDAVASKVTGIPEGEYGATSVNVKDLGLVHGKTYYWYSVASDQNGNSSAHSKTIEMALTEDTQVAQSGCMGGGNAAFALLALSLMPRRRRP